MSQAEIRKIEAFVAYMTSKGRTNILLNELNKDLPKLRNEVGSKMLRQWVKEVDFMVREMLSPIERVELKEVLEKTVDADQFDLDDEKQIEKILLAGIVHNPEEYDILMRYVDRCAELGGDKERVARANVLLATADSRKAN